MTLHRIAHPRRSFASSVDLAAVGGVTKQPSHPFRPSWLHRRRGRRGRHLACCCRQSRRVCTCGQQQSPSAQHSTCLCIASLTTCPDREQVSTVLTAKGSTHPSDWSTLAGTAMVTTACMLVLSHYPIKNWEVVYVINMCSPLVPGCA